MNCQTSLRLHHSQMKLQLWKCIDALIIVQKIINYIDDTRLWSFSRKININISAPYQITNLWLYSVLMSSIAIFFLNWKVYFQCDVILNTGQVVIRLRFAQPILTSCVFNMLPFYIVFCGYLPFNHKYPAVNARNRVLMSASGHHPCAVGRGRRTV